MYIYYRHRYIDIDKYCKTLKIVLLVIHEKLTNIFFFFKDSEENDQAGASFNYRTSGRVAIPWWVFYLSIILIVLVIRSILRHVLSIR